MRLRVVLLMVFLICLRGGVSTAMAGGMVQAELQRVSVTATAAAMPDCHGMQDMAEPVAIGCLCLACEACTLNALATPEVAAVSQAVAPNTALAAGERFASADPSPRLKPPIS